MTNIDWVDLEKFNSFGARRGEPLISISSKQTITFNAYFIKVANLKNYDYVIIFYSKTKNAIVFKFINEAEQGAIKISKGINASISARSFFNYYDFDKDFKGRFIPIKETIENIGDIWAIYLNKNIDS